MKRALLTAALASAVPGAAIAADLPRGPAPYYAPAPSSYYRWSGLYAGLNGGYEWGSVSHTGTSPNGFFGGAQLGYNFQSGGFVFGGESDLQFSDANDTFAPYKFSNPWFGTSRLRAGVAMNNMLFYATGGFAYGDVKGVNAGLSETRTHLGWTGGVGMEVGFTPNWSAKVEYLYMDLGDRAYSITGMSNNFDSNLLRLGVNYRF